MDRVSVSSKYRFRKGEGELPRHSLRLRAFHGVVLASRKFLVGWYEVHRDGDVVGHALSQRIFVNNIKK